jgi:hypothetical protein
MYKLLFTILLAMVSMPSSAQWYQKDYGVDRIDILTDVQMDEAEDKAKEIAGNGAIVIGAGAVSCLAGYLYLRYGLGEEPTLVEELLGPRVIGKGLIALGIGTAATGAVIAMVGLTRKSSIQSARNRYYLQSSLNITPILISSEKGSLHPGLSVTISF